MTDVQTGIPSVDQPWRRYYTKSKTDAPSPDCSMYEFLYENNKNHMDSIALNYFGKRVTFEQMFSSINSVASALLVLGIKPGDFVSLCALNTPEFIYLLYALNKIGALSNWIGLSSPEEDLRAQMLNTQSKIVFTVDVAIDLIKKAAVNTRVERIISVPIDSSMPPLIRIGFRLKNARPVHRRDDNWANFIKHVGKEFEVGEIRGSDLAMIEYTGGSTGVPKGVMLSNMAMNSYYINFDITNDNGMSSYNRGDRFIDGVPLFLAFGASSCCHGPLCHTMELVLAPDPSPEAGANIAVKSKVNHVVAGHLMIEALIDKVKGTNTDLRFIKSIMYGGEETNRVWEHSVKNRLQKNNMNAPVLNGYGMTECAAAVLIGTENVIDGLIPLANVNCKVTDPEDCHTEYGYNTEGELCISSDTIMIGYYNNSDETKDMMFEENGVRWLKTHDLATISKEGVVRITGRIKRIYYRFTEDRVGVRVYPMRIEEAIISDENVRECAVVGVKDEITAYRTVAYIILEDDKEESKVAEKRIDDLCRNEMPESHIPDMYFFVSEFPRTRAGKIDFRTLEIIAEKQIKDEKTGLTNDCGVEPYREK